MLRSGTCCVIEKLPQKLRKLISAKSTMLQQVGFTEEAECTDPQTEPLEVEC